MLCQDLTEQDSGTERLLDAEGLISHIQLLTQTSVAPSHYLEDVSQLVKGAWDI